MLVLKKVMANYNLKQVELAKALNLSTATINLLVNHGIYPKSINTKELQTTIQNWLEAQGITVNSGLFEVVTEGCNPQPLCKASPTTEDDLMLLKKQPFPQATRQVFGLFKDPFAEPTCSDDLYLSPDARYVSESLKLAAKQPHFMAVVGESGSGKSTLRKDLKNRFMNEPVIIIEPYVLAMEDDDFKGKTLKSAQIADAILAKIDPSIHPKRSAEAKFRQVHNCLCESAKIGNKHILIIEEAHSLPIPTLKHLKRFYELESDDGYNKLLSIVLIGQTELGTKLSEANPTVREVVQRCEVVNLRPLGEHLKPYLAHRFKRANKELSDIIDDDAIEALRAKLTVNSRGRNNSMLYPLAIHNTLIAAMNLAAAIGEKRITADVITGV